MSRSTPLTDDVAHPGAGLGLPASGVGSIAGVGRRLLALMIDWTMCRAISMGFFHDRPLVTLGIFALSQVLFLVLLGGSPGHLITGLRLRTDQGGPVLPLAAFKRTLLLCLVIPAVIYDAEHRGLHDRAAGTVLLRVR